MQPTHIRWLIRRDLPDVLRIAHLSEEEPWGEEQFVENLRRRMVIGHVAEDAEGRILGYMIYELRKKQLTLLKLAVHPAFRRQGVGTQMIAKLASKLSPERRTRLVVDVEDGNLDGHLFLKAMDFIARPIGPSTYRFTRRVKQGREMSI